jgi:hypothetical protein
MTSLWIAVGVVWASVCLGVRVRLHRRLVVAGVPLPVLDWVLRAMGARWMPRLALALLVAQAVRDPQPLAHYLQGFGWRDVLILGVAGAFRLLSMATWWAELRAVEVRRIHRLDLRISLIWECCFWVHVTLTLLPYVLWR